MGLTALLGFEDPDHDGHFSAKGWVKAAAVTWEQYRTRQKSFCCLYMRFFSEIAWSQYVFEMAGLSAVEPDMMKVFIQ